MPQLLLQTDPKHSSIRRWELALLSMHFRVTQYATYAFAIYGLLTFYRDALHIRQENVTSITWLVLGECSRTSILRVDSFLS